MLPFFGYAERAVERSSGEYDRDGTIDDRDLEYLLLGCERLEYDLDHERLEYDLDRGRLEYDLDRGRHEYDLDREEGLDTCVRIIASMSFAIL